MEGRRSANSPRLTESDLLRAQNIEKRDHRYQKGAYKGGLGGDPKRSSRKTPKNQESPFEITGASLSEA